MKVYSVTSTYSTNYSTKKINHLPNYNVQKVQTPAFKGFYGRAIGGIIGASLVGLSITPATLTVPVILASELGGALVGMLVGNKIDPYDE